MMTDDSYLVWIPVVAPIGNSNKQTNNNDLLEKEDGTKNCIYKD